MPRAAFRQCPAPGCGALTSGGPCERHRPKDERRHRHAVYNLRAWRDRLRPAKLAANPLCEDCERRGKLVAATDVDHVDGDEWNWAWENLQSLCHPCHSRKTAATQGGFGNKIKGLGGA